MESIQYGKGMTKRDQVDSLILYLNKMIPYAPSLIENWNEQEKEKQSYTSQQLHYLTESGSIDDQQMMNLVMNKQSNDKKVQQRLNDLKEEESIIWDKKSKMSSGEQYKNSLFVCYNFTDLTAEISNNMLGVKTYAAGLPGHAFNAFVFDNELFTGDTTWGLTTRPIAQDIVERPYFDWSKYDYNPAISAAAGRDFFNDQMNNALNIAKPETYNYRNKFKLIDKK